MVEIEDIKLFEKAVDERLTAEETESFQQRLSKNARFRANYEKYRQIILAVHEQQHYDALNVLLEENYKARNWALSQEELKNQRTFWPLLLGGSLILILIIASVFWLSREPSPDEELTETRPQTEQVVQEKQSDTDPVAPQANAEESSTEQESAQGEGQPGVKNPTAFLIGQSGFFLTQYSSVKNARSLRIRHSDSTEYKVDLAFADSLLDIAVLKIVSGTWPTSLRLPYRLATTRALTGTEVMVVHQHSLQNFSEGVLVAANEGHPDHEYVVEPQLDVEISGGLVISRNGNVVAIAISANGGTKFIKSTYLVGTLSANAQQLEGYRPGIDNRLAGLEREEQIQRIAPFLFEVIRFY